MKHLLSLSAAIEHTLLKAEADEALIRKHCDQAREHHFAGVCVYPSYLPLCRQLLEDTGVRLVTVVGFPHGASFTKAKACEAELAIAVGAHEIDMVIAIGALKSKNFSLVHQDIKEVCSVVPHVPVKAIIETGLLSEEEKVSASQICEQAGAAYVKTCTGFAPGQATVSDVKLIRSVIGANMRVKASGGIRTAEEAFALLQAGANRIGTSSGPKIAEQAASLARRMKQPS